MLVAPVKEQSFSQSWLQTGTAVSQFPVLSRTTAFGHGVEQTLSAYNPRIHD